MPTTEYKICPRCCMDTTAPEIVFTDTGCNFCDLAERMRPLPYGKHIRWPDMYELLALKTSNEYDVILGLSGGIDSSWCLHLLKKNGIKVLTYTIDNGYNTPQADENILKMVETLEVPFFRYTIDLEKFRELQGAFIKAGLKNIEIPTDHILMASAYEVANTYGIKTIISGGNWATESVMPRSWGYQPRDLKHIKAICGDRAKHILSSLPTCGLLKFNYFKWIKGIKTINLLDYVEYNREEAIQTLQRSYGWEPYLEKHCENYFTWWFQNYYLFTKFGIDKRKAHLSSLILSGQMSRSEALEILQTNPVYPRMGIEEKVLKYPKHEYTDYPNDEKLFEAISSVIRWLRKYANIR